MSDTAKIDRAVKYIDSWLRFKFERTDIPGMTVAISHKGKIIFSRAYGYANLESKEKMTTDHIFRIASHSKTFTATAIMQLQEQGRLKLDDKLVVYLPWLEEHKDKRWTQVTIRQLLSHLAGVIRDGDNSDFWQLLNPFLDEEEFKQEILKGKLIFDTNTLQKYSNYGFTLLGMIVAAASGEDYNQYVSKNIVKPLGLKSTHPEIDKSAQLYVTGYTRKEPNDRLPVDIIDTHAMSAATGFCSTAEDMCRYFSAHIVGSGKLLDDESKKEMQRTQSISRTPSGRAEEYGLGLDIVFIDRHRLFGHSGGFPGQITDTLCDPKNQIVVSVLTNCINPDAEAVEGIYSVIYKFLEESAPVKEADYKFEGRFMSLWGVNDIVVFKDKILNASPQYWKPFEYAEVFEKVDDMTLKIKQATMASDRGELVIYNPDGTIRSGGMTMWPESEYMKQIKNKKVISL